MVSHLVFFYLNFSLIYTLLFVKKFVASATNAAATPVAGDEPATTAPIAIIAAITNIALTVISERV
ncbi:hypothetical protein MWLp12_pB0035 (plasmid) [Lactiplantibacillus plantarum]|nr:hypothetical protein MWLp12_pB0035 [Lactiplantibacillus plantarum]